jgi:hypothetical protein
LENEDQKNKKGSWYKPNTCEQNIIIGKL